MYEPLQNRQEIHLYDFINHNILIMLSSLLSDNRGIVLASRLSVRLSAKF